MRWASLLACGVAASSCYSPPISSERLEESVVITTRDEDVDFESYGTFFIRPEIRLLDEEDTGVTRGIDVVPDTLAAPLVAATRDNFLARGYTEAATKEEADLAVEMVYLRSVATDYYCYYWGDWLYWGYPGYYYYYPYSCSYSSWTSGMLVTHAVELPLAPESGAMPGAPAAVTAAPSDTDLLRGVWYSGIYAVELDEPSYVVQRTVAGINEAFDQSPYLQAGP